MSEPIDTGVFEGSMKKLTDEEIDKLVLLFCNLRREYEEFRKGNHIMESGNQYVARMIEFDLGQRGYKTK